MCVPRWNSIRALFRIPPTSRLLDDQQREDIGKRYKNAGQDEAIRLGLKLATDDIRAQRLAAWRAIVRGIPVVFYIAFAVACVRAPHSNG